MTILLTDLFTGTNGDPWVSPWVDESTDISIVDIQTNRGRLTRNGGSGWPRTFTSDQGTALNLRYRAQMGSTVCAIHCGFMVGATWNNEDPYDAYVIYTQGDTAPQLARFVAGTYGALGTIGSDPGTSDYWYRLYYDPSDGSLKAKQWSGAVGDEPGAWDVEVTDTNHQGETFRLVYTAWISSDHFIDDLELADLASAEGGPTPSVVSIDLDFATMTRTRTVT